MSSNFRRLAELGQSVWYDNIRRGMLMSGEMQALIDEGILGVTSNPTIFHKAISGSSDYDEALAESIAAGRSAEEVYEALVLEDIGRAADLFLPVYDRAEGRDGFVSIEVEPALANDTDGTVERARELFGKLNRPNIMIKVPGTEAGLPAIRVLLGEGVNVNVTLIFSVTVYERILEAYLSGLKAFVEGGGDPKRVASVASFFVSRVDTLVDERLQARIDAGERELQSLLGQAAVANAKIAYERFREVFGGKRFASLRAKGVRVQRPLWASTSTKDPAYRDTLYVDTLVGSDTVNTVPPATLDAIRKLPSFEAALERDVDQAHSMLANIEEAGIRMDDVTEELRTAGVQAFADSFEALMQDIRKRIEG